MSETLNVDINTREIEQFVFFAERVSPWSAEGWHWRSEIESPVELFP